MATTQFFSKVLRDKEPSTNDATIELRFGRSSLYGESLIYFEIDGKTVIVDKKTGRNIFEAMMKLGAYLGYDK